MYVAAFYDGEISVYERDSYVPYVVASSNYRE